VSRAGSYLLRFAATGKNVSSDLLDFGKVFGTHANGLEYGWNKENKSGSWGAGVSFADGRGEKTGHKWEMVLPNGTYNVLLGCRGRSTGALDYHGYKTDVFREGSGKTPSVNNFLVEAVPFDDPDGPENLLDLIEHPVAVKDGRLTVEGGKGAKDPRLCYISITSVD